MKEEEKKEEQKIPETAPKGHSTSGKDAYISFRLPKGERALAERKAAQAGLSLSKFCRRSLQNAEVRVLSGEEIRIHKGIANNFNQLVKLWHTFGGNPPEGLLEQLEKLIGMYEREIRREK